MTDPDKRELLWRQYQMHVDLFKSYLELTLKFNAFYYAITGAILSFYFANKTDAYMRWSLFLPLLMSISFALFMLYGAQIAKITRQEIFDIRDALGFQVAPEVMVLIALLRIFGGLCLIMTMALIVIMIKC